MHQSNTVIIFSVVLMVIGFLIMIHAIIGGVIGPKDGQLKKLIDRGIHPRVDFNVIEPKTTMHKFKIFLIGLVIFVLGLILCI